MSVNNRRLTEQVEKLKVQQEQTKSNNPRSFQSTEVQTNKNPEQRNQEEAQKENTGPGETDADSDLTNAK